MVLILIFKNIRKIVGINIDVKNSPKKEVTNSYLKTFLCGNICVFLYGLK